MKLSKMAKEELELYSYIDLSKMILEEEAKPLNTPTIFRKICDLLELSDSDYTDKIGDYYTSLTTDKDFVLLPDGNWDLRDHHPVATILDDDEVYEEDDLEDIEEAEEEMEELADDSDDDLDEEVSLDDIEDLDEDDDDLTIIDEEELED